MHHTAWLWIGFLLFVVAMLAIDLGLFHRKSHEIKVKEALVMSAVWIGLALIFNVGVYYFLGHDAGLKFLTGYLLEKSLSVDNLFVFLLIFSYFRVPSTYQHKILFWGILGALVMRAIFIFGGISLVSRFHWLFYVMGAFLVFTGIKLAFEKDKEIHPDKNPMLRLFQKIVPVSKENHGSKFFVRKNGKLFATPLLLVLIVVETTDVIFAVDSVPAILSITLDPFIVFSSNVFAILGLRALYFALAGIMQMFHHLHYGLSLILVFVGVKMLIEDWVKIPISYSLSAIALILAGSIIASIIWPKPAEPTDIEV